MSMAKRQMEELEEREWLADPEGYEAEQAAIREWHEYDMHDDPAFWQDEPEPTE